jgi:hypothetical protein
MRTNRWRVQGDDGERAGGRSSRGPGSGVASLLSIRPRVPRIPPIESSQNARALRGTALVGQERIAGGVGLPSSCTVASNASGCLLQQPTLLVGGGSNVKPNYWD